MLVTEAYMHVADAYMHFTDSNMRADTATTLNCQILIRAHPFEHMPFHGKNRQDFVIWRRIRESSQTNLIWTIQITRRSWGTAGRLCFSRAKCGRQNVCLWKSNTWCSWRKCGGTLHPSPTTWPTNISVISSTVRDPTLRTTWWTLTTYWDQQLYSDAQ